MLLRQCQCISSSTTIRVKWMVACGVSVLVPVWLLLAVCWLSVAFLLAVCWLLPLSFMASSAPAPSAASAPAPASAPIIFRRKRSRPSSLLVLSSDDDFHTKINSNDQSKTQKKINMTTMSTLKNPCQNDHEKDDDNLLAHALHTRDLQRKRWQWRKQKQKQHQQHQQQQQNNHDYHHWNEKNLQNEQHTHHETLRASREILQFDADEQEKVLNHQKETFIEEQMRRRHPEWEKGRQREMERALEREANKQKIAEDRLFEFATQAPQSRVREDEGRTWLQGIEEVDIAAIDGKKTPAP